MKIVDISSSDITLRTSDTWDSLFSQDCLGEPSSLRSPLSRIFLKVNFDSSVVKERSGIGFMIRGPNSQLIMTGKVQLVEITMPGVEIRVA